MKRDSQSSKNLEIYQGMPPNRIASLPDQEFEEFLTNRVYRVHEQFNLSEDCLLRLINWMQTQLQPSLKAFKMIKNLLKFYGIRTAIFLESFYQKIDAFLSETLNSSPDQHPKCIKYLQEISALSQKMSGAFKSSSLNFLTRYGTYSKKEDLQKDQNNEISQLVRKMLECLQEWKDLQSKNAQLFDKNTFRRKIVKFIEQSRISNDILLSLNFERIRSKITDSIDETFLAAAKELHNISSDKCDVSNMSMLSKEELCCRTFFVENQTVIQSESPILEYKNYRFPYDEHCRNILKKTICGFLNRSGGCILIGIQECNQTKYKQVRGQFLSENQKEEVNKEIRYVCSSIFPNVVESYLYSVKFVPIKKSQTSPTFVSGKYVVRLSVKPGLRENFYSFYHFDERTKLRQQMVAFRTENQVFKKQLSQEIIQIYLKRLEGRNDHIRETHEGECAEPEEGKKIYHEVNEPLEVVRIIAGNQQGQTKSRSRSKSTNDRFKKTRFTAKELTAVQSVKVQQNSPKTRANWALDDEQEEQERRQRLRRNMRELQNYVTEVNESQQESLLFDRNLNDDKKLNNGKKKYKPKYSNTIGQVSNGETGGKFGNRSENMRRGKFTPQTKPEEFLSKETETNQGLKGGLSPFSEYSSYLVIGPEFHIVKQVIKQTGIQLEEQPVNCHKYLVTWIKVKLIPSNTDKLIESTQELKRLCGGDGKVKVRKVELYFKLKSDALQDKIQVELQISPVFVNSDTRRFYQFQDELSAIKAYLQGLKMQETIKFITYKEFKAESECFANRQFN